MVIKALLTSDFPLRTMLKIDLNMDKSSSSSGEEEGTSVRDKFVDMCTDLNMDEESRDTAWESYVKIDKNYTLEVIRFNPLIGCSKRPEYQES